MSRTTGTGGGVQEILPVGSHFGDYIIERVLGSGGMGVVYLAHTQNGDRYAVKVMHPSKMTHALRRRFAREAEFAMNTRHKNLISVYDVGEDPDTGLCYIIMDYMPGGSLADRIEARGQLSVREAISIVRQVAEGLEVAHSSGLIHRDVKPDNVLFAADGTPKLADLGVAKFGEVGGTMMTLTGMVIGTPAYMAPEQMMDAHSIDARADVYSLGVVLFEMLSGKSPNADSTAVELLAKAIRGDPLPDIRTLRPEISASLAYVLSRMCAPSPAERPATAYAASELLRRASIGKLKPPRKSPRVDGMDRKPEGVQAGGKHERNLMGLSIQIGTVCIGLAALVLAGVAVSRGGRDDAGAVQKAGGAAAAAPRVVDESDASAGKAGVLRAKVGEHWWTYSVEDGAAVIGCGGDARSGDSAIDPSPYGCVVVPDELDGRKVVALGRSVFLRCEDVADIVLPEGLKELRGWGTFYGCWSLKRLNLPSTVVKMGGAGAVVSGCPVLEVIDLANCREFSGRSVVDCQALQSYMVSKSNPSYVSKDGALYSKDGRTLVRWPEGRSDVKLASGVEVIGDNAFLFCNVRTLELPPSIREIGANAFGGCKVAELKIPEGVVKVGTSAFSGCRMLKKVVFPKTLEELSCGNLFGGCRSLRTVEFHGDMPRIVGSDSARRYCLAGTPEGLEVIVGSSARGWRGNDGRRLVKWPEGCKDARNILFKDF